MTSAQPSTESKDPRVLRTRRMLMDSLTALLRRKPFEDISIQEIAEEATLNRNTFYLHYPDKNSLLLAMTNHRFRSLIADRGIRFDDCNGALRATALGVCDYLMDVTNCPERGALIPLEGAIIPAIEGMFMEAVSHHRVVPGIDAALIATTAAWAIFGAARRWHHESERIPAEEMASQIERMVKPLFLNSFD